jgi:intracellular septation protein
MSHPSHKSAAAGEPAHPPLQPLLKIALDLGPLALFVAANARFGIFIATAVFMVAVVIALAIYYVMTRRLPIMPLVTAGLVLVFGALTLILQDESFIKFKATIVYLLFAGALFGGLIFGKPLLGVVFDSVFNLTQEGWRKLTMRWAIFFLVLAGLNEIVWRTQTTEVWFAFKWFGVIPLTFVFAALQNPLLTKYAAPDPAVPPPA